MNFLTSGRWAKRPNYQHSPQERNSDEMLLRHTGKNARNFGTKSLADARPLNTMGNGRQNLTFTHRILDTFHKARNKMLSKFIARLGLGSPDVDACRLDVETIGTTVASRASLFGQGNYHAGGSCRIHD